MYIPFTTLLSLFFLAVSSFGSPIHQYSRRSPPHDKLKPHNLDLAKGYGNPFLRNRAAHHDEHSIGGKHERIGGDPELGGKLEHQKDIRPRQIRSPDYSNRNNTLVKVKSPLHSPSPSMPSVASSHEPRSNEDYGDPSEADTEGSLDSPQLSQGLPADLDNNKGSSSVRPRKATRSTNSINYKSPARGAALSMRSVHRHGRNRHAIASPSSHTGSQKSGSVKKGHTKRIRRKGWRHPKKGSGKNKALPGHV